jgi:branched-chain amino acid transport system ATP-binding protein
MPDNWGFVAAAYGLTAAVLLWYWRRLGRQERELRALERSTTERRRERVSGERSQERSRSGHPRSEPASRPPLPWTIDRVHALFPRLRERRAQSGGTLSGGEQQMLAIGRALMTGPRLLVLDEPSEGLAPLIVREIGRVLMELKAAGLAVLLVEQNVPLALRVADRVYVMSKGQIVYHGASSALDADEDVKRRFLGIA